MLKLQTDRTNDLKIEKIRDGFNINTQGDDPYIFTAPLKRKLDKNTNRISFEYFCPTGLDFVEVYFYPLKESRDPIIIHDIGSTEGWVEFTIDISDYIEGWGKKGHFLRLDFGGAAGLNIQIRNLQIRSITKREKEIQRLKETKKQEEAILKASLLNYLSEDFPNEVSDVLIKKDKIIIKGKTTGKRNLYLIDISIYNHASQVIPNELIHPIYDEDGSFEISVDRYINRHGFKQDRLLSKWMLVSKENESFFVESHARYVDSIVPKYTYKYMKPLTIKGLGGYSADREAPSSDLEELGIESVTVNVWINGLLRSQDSEENMSFEYMGKTYYVNKERLEKYDKTFMNTAARDIEVSAILLVSKASQSADKEIGKILQHPDTDPAGIYAMPNLTSPEGVQYYAAILDFLAKRYSRPDKKYGRIHHWIIHNEVDAGWVWTNAGEKESLVFMDIYHKSMRMTYNIARKYNPNSKVFISLTHYWNWTSNSHFYHSKELLEQLLDFSKAEGNFEWAIAQHPYPESLREPKTWLDKKTSYDFDTKLITFKNIEVLDAWVKRPEVLYKGRKRTVYLSENGTNSPTYSERDLNEQAAGMAYALKKIKYLDGIDGFQYHNWQDNRKEGGLRIGLRRFPDAEENPGGKKPVWFVYEAFGTPREDEVFDQYKEIIGIDDWNEIRYTGEFK